MMFRYLGLDIVPELVLSARERLGDERTRFMQADVALLDVLPSAELIFSRQMMQHQCAAGVIAPRCTHTRCTLLHSLRPLSMVSGTRRPRLWSDPQMLPTLFVSSTALCPLASHS